MDGILDISPLVDSDLRERLLGDVRTIADISPVVASPEISKLSGVEDLFRVVSQSPTERPEETEEEQEE